MKFSGVHVLGPGKRYGLWLQGCYRHCKGCIAQNSWDLNGGEDLSVDTLVKEILNEKVDGITISGGEPFLQCEELCDLIRRIKIEKDLGIILYTGYSLEELNMRQNSSINYILKSIDVLIDGEYVEELDDNKAFRGSSNQKIHHLSKRYIDYFESNFIARENEFVINGNEFVILGIPNKTSKILKNKFKGD